MVKIELRSAQRIALLELPQAFVRGGAERIAWRRFGDFRSHLRNAATFRITAIDATGKAVTGQCLVDDFATLTSDPVHRSAWRAAVALLGTEGMPEYADIAALFSLAEVTAVEDELGDQGDSPQSAKRIAGSTKDTKREKTAIWPPPPLLDDTIHVGSLGSGAGNVYWFNRILASFLSRTALNPISTGDAAETLDAGDDEEGDSGQDGAPQIVPQSDDEVARAARRLWEQAADAMNGLRVRLKPLEVTGATAHRIWGLSVLVFLGALHIARAIRSRKELRDSVPSTAALARTWLAMMVFDRDQGDSYKRSAASVYPGRYFPSLAWDMFIRFKIAPHPEVLAIIYVAFAHVRVSESERRAPITIVELLLLRHLTGDLIDEVFRDEVHLEKLWKSYFQDEDAGVTWPTVQKILMELQRTTFTDSPGFQDLKILLGLSVGGQINATQKLSEFTASRLPMFRVGGYKSIEVSSYDEGCSNWRCPIYGDAIAEFRALRELKPVVCPACGLLMIPDRLAEVFRSLSNG
jgi:hypothetical protein